MGNTVHIQEQFILLDAFLNNKEVPIRDFYVDEFPKTRNYIYKNGGTEDQAKDVFQEAYLACWKKLSTSKFSPNNKAEIEAYLFTIAKNKWIDQVRRDVKRKTTSIDTKLYQLEANESTEQQEQKLKEEKMAITLAAFENLGSACKELLKQFYFHKLSLRRIAEVLNIEETSAKNKKYRCIQKLKELASQNSR